MSLNPAFRATREKRRRKYQEEKDRCAADIVYWCNAYVKTYDPRLLEEGENPNVPFVLYEYQVEYLQWLQDRLDGKEHGLVEKSRDMGASWLNIVFDVHKWLFTPGYKAGIGSYKEDKVDRRGDMDSLFEKIRHLIEHLPKWMQPAGFQVGGEYDNFLRITNPENGSTITGEAGKNIGRGGRNTRYTLDEHAFLEQAQEVERAVSQNTNCIIYTSTPNGMGNLFAQKRFSGKVPVFTMHWTKHPKKNQAWYDKQARTLDSVTLAQEVDIDYSASVEGIMIDPTWVRAAVDLDIEKSGPKVAGLDVGEKRDESCYISRHGVVVTRIEQWGKMNTTQTAYKAKELGERDGIEKLKYDDLSVGAGVTGTLVTEREDSEQVSETEGLFELIRPPFVLIGVSWGSTDVQGEAFWDNETKKLKERFLNQRAADWWHLRLRFESTYEHVNGIKEHPLEHLISIPNDNELIAQLSLPLKQYSTTGKTKLESKKDMKKRGVSSPNKADALAYCFSTYQQPFIVGVW